MSSEVGPGTVDNRAQRFESIVAAVLDPLQRYVHRRAPRALVEDTIADALLVLWRRLDDVPAEAPIPWALGVARGCLANRLRAHRRQDNLLRRLELEPLVVPDAGPAEPDDEVRRGLQVLSAADRELLQLWAWESLEPREIAVVLGTTPNAAAIRLHRAKRRLRRVIESGKSDGTAGHERVEHEER
jgi:RNA polymerase sigma-70 factor, ECF subfamily